MHTQQNISWLSRYRNRMAATFGGVTLLIVLALGYHAQQEATTRLTEQRGEEFSAITTSIANMLAANINEREREMTLLSQRPILTSDKFDSEAVREELDRIKQSYRYYAWIGIADKHGIIRSATDSLLKGEDVSERPWFIYGKNGPYLGDVHEAVLLARLLDQPNPSEPIRFLDYASPIFDSNGDFIGVVAGHVMWNWVPEYTQKTLPTDLRHYGSELFIANAKGELLHPLKDVGKLTIPMELLAKDNYLITEWENHERFFTAIAKIETDTSMDIGWRVIMRQPLSHALMPVKELQQSFLIFGLVATLLVGFIAYFLAGSFVRPIHQLIELAKRIERGDEHIEMRVDSHLVEIKLLSTALNRMATTLIARKQEVNHINRNLEKTVNDRTKEHRIARERAERLAITDGLTGLFNRLKMDEVLDYEVKRSTRYGHPLTVALFDIDDFKSVNDTYGHDVGDEVLRVFSTLVKENVRSVDIAGRVGGEEFLIIFPETNLADTKNIAEKLRIAIETHNFLIVGKKTASFGVAELTTNDSQSSLIKRADEALYKAKNSGRNRVIS